MSSVEGLFELGGAGVHGVSKKPSLMMCWLFLRVMIRETNITRKQGQHGLLTRVYARLSSSSFENATRRVYTA